MEDFQIVALMKKLNEIEKKIDLINKDLQTNKMIEVMAIVTAGVAGLGGHSAKEIVKKGEKIIEEAAKIIDLETS